MSSTSKAKTSQASQQPKIKWKGNEEFRHDLFKAEVKTFKKNTSYKKGVVRIEEVEHVHFFHSHNSQGKEQKYTNAVGGHFHEIKTSVDQDGNLTAECGPALKYVTLKVASGSTKKKIVPVKWTVAEDERSDGGEITDRHTHEMTYVRSEIVSPQKVKQTQSETQYRILEEIKKQQISAYAEQAG